MAALTPVKVLEVNCFVCCVARIKTIKLDGRKSKEDCFCLKLKFVLNNDSLFKTLTHSERDLPSASVCRNCYQKIEKAYDFILQLRSSANNYVCKGGSCDRIKRGIESPKSPKSVNTSLHDCLPVKNRSRKQLKLSPGKVEQVPSNYFSRKVFRDTEHIDDHGYSQPSCDTEMSSESPVLSDLRAILKEVHNISSSEGSVILKELRAQSSSLTSRTASFCSVLYKYRDISKLEGSADHFLDEIIEEMIRRVPFLLKVMLCIATPANENMKPSIIPAIASAYSILMKHKYDNLSAYHRLTTIIAIKGGLDERAQTRFNQLGLMLSWSTRLSLQEGIQIMTEKVIAENLKHNPLIKVTGDNLDIYVKTSHLSKERRNKDLHLFTSNIIFSRVSTMDMNNTPPKIDITELNSEKVLMSEKSSEKEKLLYSYAVLLGRTLCKIPAFKQYGKLFPKHIPHEFSEKMSRKSIVHPLPIMFKNECKHEDCMSIMDGYEDQLTSIYNLAFGNADLLRKYGVPVGGDQLTRVRLQEAKNLRSLSVTPVKRYDDLHPIVCEMWHMKQDLLEKCYKLFFKADLTPGTLYHFKTILHRTDVNGKVKGRFQPHFSLLMAVGEELVTEQFLEFFEMDGKESKPKHNLLDDLTKMSPVEQTDILMNTVQIFMKHYGYGQVDCPKEINKNYVAPNIIGYSKDVNDNIIIKYTYPKVISTQPDELFNYSMQLCHWYLHLTEMHDTAKEGDLNRTILNCQYTLPFFYSHSKLSKYLVESIDYVLKCKYMLSPLQRMRVLEGSYVNTKGGKGQNVESDLTQEHSVCNQKALIKSLVANKSEKSIKRVTGAANTIAEICSKFDENVSIKPKSGHHSKPLNDTDRDLISQALRKIRPFHIVPGRKCPGFANINSIPVSRDRILPMKERLNQIIIRLSRGLNVVSEEDDEEDDDDA